MTDSTPLRGSAKGGRDERRNLEEVGFERQAHRYWKGAFDRRVCVRGTSRRFAIRSRSSVPYQMYVTRPCSIAAFTSLQT
jgi:hypothetical protein